MSSRVRMLCTHVVVWPSSPSLLPSLSFTPPSISPSPSLSSLSLFYPSLPFTSSSLMPLPPFHPLPPYPSLPFTLSFPPFYPLPPYPSLPFTLSLLTPPSLSPLRPFHPLLPSLSPLPPFHPLPLFHPLPCREQFGLATSRDVQTPSSRAKQVSAFVYLTPTVYCTVSTVGLYVRICICAYVLYVFSMYGNACRCVCTCIPCVFNVYGFMCAVQYGYTYVSIYSTYISTCV